MIILTVCRISRIQFKGAKLLDETFKNFNKETLQTMVTMHEIEHSADLEAHEITKGLQKV